MNKAVKRNAARFPADFMLTLAPEEARILRFQFGTLRWGAHSKYAPRVFTQEGVAMLSGVLNSPRAIQVNIEIMRAFVRLRSVVSASQEAARRIDRIEKSVEAHENELAEHAVDIHDVFVVLRRMGLDVRRGA